MQSTSMKAASILATEWIRELEGEVRSTRECLQEVPMDKADWSPTTNPCRYGSDKRLPPSTTARIVLASFYPGLRPGLYAIARIRELSIVILPE